MKVLVVQLDGKLPNYEFQTQAYERRIETLIEAHWETLAETGECEGATFVFEVSYE